jgi:hypothetical protein
MEYTTRRTPEERAEQQRKQQIDTLDSWARAGFQEIPEKYRGVRLSQLAPSDKSRLPLDGQQKLYDELRANPLGGWAFFAPAGYSKTTCSWALYKIALVDNLKRCLLTSGGTEWEPDRPNRTDSPWVFVFQASMPEWLARIQASWDGGQKPRLNFEKMGAARKLGYTPRVFLSEIDKIKDGSDWATNQIFMLFDAIDVHKGQLVFDTNLSREQFLNRFGEAIYRRVKENCERREYGF